MGINQIRFTIALNIADTAVGGGKFVDHPFGRACGFCTFAFKTRIEDEIGLPRREMPLG